MKIHAGMLTNVDVFKIVLLDCEEDEVTFPEQSGMKRYKIHTIKWGSEEDGDYKETYIWVLEMNKGRIIHGRTLTGKVQHFHTRHRAKEHFVDYLKRSTSRHKIQAIAHAGARHVRMN